MNPKAKPEQKGNPQLEGGYTKVADEILEVIMRMPLLDRKSRIIMAILRFSYGCGNKFTRLTCSDISLATGIDRSNIAKTLRELNNLKIISWDKANNILGFNKLYREWNLSVDWGEFFELINPILKKNLNLVNSIKEGVVDLTTDVVESTTSVVKSTTAKDLDFTGQNEKSLDTGQSSGCGQIDHRGVVNLTTVNPSQPTTGAACAPPINILKTTSSTPPTHPNREVPLPSPTPDPSQFIDQGQGSRLSEAGTGKDVSKGKGVVADKKRILRTSFIQGNTIDQAFSLFGELEPALRGFIEDARKARERGISENLVLATLFTLKTLYDQDKELFALALGKVMSKEDFDYKKKNLTGLVEWYFKNPETLRRGTKSGAHKNDPSGCNRKAFKERPKSRDPDPYADISTKDIPYGDPRLDNEDDPYEDISTRDIPL